MTGPTRTFEERLLALIDGRLDDAERTLLERELETDPQKRRTYEALLLVEDASREALETEPPDGLEARIRRGLDAVDAETAAARRRPSVAGWTWAAAAAVLVVAILSAIYFIGGRSSTSKNPLPDLVAADMHDYEHGRLVLSKQTVQSVELERYFVQQGIEFPTRVFDLIMMEFKLVGGVSNELDGRRSAAFAYDGPGGKRLLCQMYEGSVDELPPTDDVREHDGIIFYSYEVDCVKMTFWREGDVICVLASMGDLEEVVALAFAKAVRV